MIIGAHVDDMLLTGGDEDAIKQVKEQLKGRFEMKDLGRRIISWEFEFRDTKME